LNIHLILHGKAAGRAGLREAVDFARSKGHKVQVSVTWESGDAGRYTQQAVLQMADVIVAGGGDGTLNEVAFGLLTASPGPSELPSLGLLPLGTANDFAHGADIAVDPLAAIKSILSCPPVPVDVGRINDHVFLNLATGGFGTQITVNTSERLKKLLGGAAYLITGLSSYSTIRASNAKFTAPHFVWEGSFLVLAIGNGRQAGGGHVLCPQAKIDDGSLDLRILPAPPPEQFEHDIAQLLDKGMEAVEEAIVRAQITTLDITAEDDMYINLDGEPISGRQFHVEIMPRAIKFHLPSVCPLRG